MLYKISRKDKKNSLLVLLAHDTFITAQEKTSFHEPNSILSKIHPGD